MMNDKLLTPAEMSRQCRCLRAQREARLLARAYDAAFRDVGLTSGQFSILAALNQPEPAPLTMLAQVLGLERTTLTRNLRAIEGAKLVTSVASRDQRVRALQLTPAGVARLRAAMPLWRQVQADFAAA